MKNITIIILSLLVLGLSGFLIYDSATEGMSRAEAQKQLMNLKSDYKYIQRDLEYSIKKLNINSELIATQQQKIESLLRKNEITEAELNEAKNLMQEISIQILNEYAKRVEHLEQDKKHLEDESIAFDQKILSLTKKIDQLEIIKRSINKKYIAEKVESDKKTTLLSYAASLSLSNFNLKSVKVRSSGREVETTKASRIDKIRVSFDINENLLASSGKKILYIVVYRPDGSIATFDNVATGEFSVNGEKKQYSDKRVVDYVKNKINSVEFEWNSEDFVRGEYRIDVYENIDVRFMKIGGATKELR
jgi:hypothetical protein